MLWVGRNYNRLLIRILSVYFVLSRSVMAGPESEAELDCATVTATVVGQRTGKKTAPTPEEQAKLQQEWESQLRLEIEKEGYKIGIDGKEVEHGGEGVVFFVEKGGIRKVLKFPKMKDEAHRQSIRSELTEAHLLHEISPYYLEQERVELAGEIGVKMDYIENDLAALIRSGKLTPEQKRKIAWQLIDAIEAAHKKDIVIRDIKDENVLVDKDFNIRIADVPGARNAGERGDMNGTTPQVADGQLMGFRFTGIYPEDRWLPQAVPAVVSKRSDLYALHTTLMALFAQRHDVFVEISTPIGWNGKRAEYKRGVDGFVNRRASKAEKMLGLVFWSRGLYKNTEELREAMKMALEDPAKAKQQWAQKVIELINRGEEDRDFGPDPPTHEQLVAVKIFLGAPDFILKDFNNWGYKIRRREKNGLGLSQADAALIRESMRKGALWMSKEQQRLKFEPTDSYPGKITEHLKWDFFYKIGRNPLFTSRPPLPVWVPNEGRPQIPNAR